MADLRASQKCHLESFLSPSVPFSDRVGFFNAIKMESDGFRYEIPQPLTRFWFQMILPGPDGNAHIWNVWASFLQYGRRWGGQYPSLFYVNLNN